MDKFNNTPPDRFVFLDLLRGFAVFLMIIFHLGYDLSHFNFYHIDFFRDPIWYYFPRVIVLLFMISVGISLNLVHYPTIRWKSFGKRQFKIFIFAIIISITTYFIFPKNWIYFGTLHSIFICSIFALPFIGRKKASIAMTLVILILYLLNIQVPWIKLTKNSLDYIPPFPWIGFVTLGIVLQFYNIHKIQIKTNLLVKYLVYLGKNSLIIYIIHQPILFSFIYLMNKVLH